MMKLKMLTIIALSFCSYEVFSQVDTLSVFKGGRPYYSWSSLYLLSDSSYVFEARQSQVLTHDFGLWQLNDSTIILSSKRSLTEEIRQKPITKRQKRKFGPSEIDTSLKFVSDTFQISNDTLYLFDVEGVEESEKAFHLAYYTLFRHDSPIELVSNTKHKLYESVRGGDTINIPIQAINCDQGFRFYEEENVRVYNASCESTLNLLDSLFLSKILNVKTFSRLLVKEINSDINSIDIKSNCDYNFTGFCIGVVDFSIKNDTDDYSEFDF
jgi:hypothetical protein